MPTVLTINKTTYQAVCELRAAFHSAIPFQIMVQIIARANKTFMPGDKAKTGY